MSRKQFVNPPLPKEKKGRGRPRALDADEAQYANTITTLEGLGKISASRGECAAVLGVNEGTLIDFFKRNPEAREIYENGKGHLKVSLRRKQIEMAMKGAGNVQMLIWLGKQLLGQRDKWEGDLKSSTAEELQKALL